MAILSLDVCAFVLFVLAHFNLIRFLQQVLDRSMINLLRLQLVVPTIENCEKLLCYSQDVCAVCLRYMFVCFSCVGVHLCVGLVIKQLLALPHTSGSLSSLASHCSCHFSSFHARMTAKLPSTEQEAGWVWACSVRGLVGLNIWVWEATRCCCRGSLSACTRQQFQ